MDTDRITRFLDKFERLTPEQKALVNEYIDRLYEEEQLPGPGSQAE